jgi:hypothetical protein
MNPLLKAIADQAAADLVAQFKDGEEDILASIHTLQTEAQLQDKPAKFSLGFKIELDWEKSTINNSLSWSVKHSLDTSHQIPDPNQTKLPLDETEPTTKELEGTVTISTPGVKPVTVTTKQFAAAAKKLSKK